MNLTQGSRDHLNIGDPVRAQRLTVEAAYTFLKTQYDMTVNKVRGLRNVAEYALYSVLCFVLTREAAENMGRSNNAISPKFFNTGGGGFPAAGRVSISVKKTLRGVGHPLGVEDMVSEMGVFSQVRVYVVDRYGL